MADEDHFHCSENEELHPITSVAMPSGVTPTSGTNPVATEAVESALSALQCLAALTDFYVQQAFDPLESMAGCQRNNKFSICTGNRQEFMTAKEITDCCTRQLLGNRRPFKIDFSLTDGQTVLRLTRPLRCHGAMCCCCLQELTIQCPPGVTVGYAREKNTCFCPQYEVQDASNTPIFEIVRKRRCKLFCCCKDIKFNINSCVDGSQVGEIVKRWRGCRESFGVNHFSVHFHQDMDARMKVVLLGGTFLVDFLYFETKNKTSLVRQSLGCLLTSPDSDSPDV